MIEKINNLTGLNPQPLKQADPLKSHADITFAQLLQGKSVESQKLKFSAHAMQRLKDRNITLSNDELTKINQKVNQAFQKGAQSSLILMDKLALVVSVKNKTVITAIDDANARDHIFTNIDSAAII